MECLNCKTIFEGKFCPQCGQKSETKRFTFQKIANDTVSTITDTDKGFFFNLKNLTLNPGKNINDYLDGKRKHVFNPFSYAVLAIGIYLFVDHYYDYSIFKSFTNKNSEYKNLSPGAFNFGQKIGHFIAQYLKFFYLLNIVYLSVITWAILKKRNFVEHLVSNAFIIGHAVIITTLFIPLYKTPIFFNPITLISIAILMYFTYKNYEEKLVVFVTIFFGMVASFLLQFIVPGVIIWIKNLIF
ncbi:MAG: DUF3667 domain-containing protein [Winogradskyella sp.]|uniref:DUF3667 domain-containing protein n=1 Tax=Winogradskyella sp. TaxID=1883156 RepID=UPI000F3C5ADD|nr:DUF3667 domain-containing protein [Winogradskyella sp.]RNC84901.1 MAG: DUF3667 domain-containing protein [Winogradskyella sp.]